MKTITVTATEAARQLFRTHVEPGIASMSPSDAIEYLEAIHELATEMLHTDSEEAEAIVGLPIQQSEPKPHGLNATQLQGKFVRVRTSSGAIIAVGKVIGISGRQVNVSTKHGHFFRLPEQLELYGE